MALDHAIVMGGGMAGLLAAAGLAGQFDRVTIIDRDDLAADGAGAPGSGERTGATGAADGAGAVDEAGAHSPRRGVPQGGIVHRLLALGADRMEQLLPGLREDLLAAGCQERDGLASTAHWTGTAWRARVRSDLPLLSLSRPVLEGVIRRRVLSLPAVATRRGAASGLVFSEDGRTVCGVRARSLPDGQLLGDLVVDAAGRSSRGAGWVEDLGFDRPATQTSWVHVAYTSIRLRLPEGALPAGIDAVSLPGSSLPGSSLPGADEGTFGLDLEPIGNGEHMVSVAATAKSTPPADLEGLRALAAHHPSPLLADALANAQQVGEPASTKTASGRRLLWEAVEQAPEGLVHVGDAICAFNPMYGQGMTMAAVAATTLRGAVQAAAGEADGLAARFHRDLGTRLDPAWASALARDARIPGSVLEGPEEEPGVASAGHDTQAAQTPPPPTAEESAALAVLQAADPDVALAVHLAEQWIDPEHLRRADVPEKVAAVLREGRDSAPEHDDPRTVPALR